MRRLISTALRATAVLSPTLAGRLTFELWRRPMMRGQLREAERAIHADARVEVIDGVVTYAWGDGRRPVLLVHGWRSRASRYYGFVARLVALGYSPVSYDAPGHGDSPGRVGTILDHQRIIRSLADRHGPFESVVAHSMGVPFALYAVREGVVAGRIVAISGLAEFGYLVDAFCAALGVGPRINQALRRAVETRLFHGDREIWERFSVGAGDADLLVIHDDGDDVVVPAQADVLTARYGPKARVQRTSGLGHSRILADDQVVTEAVRFLTRAPGEPGTTDQASDVAERLDLGAQ
ncbi:alpha/beta hydrolase family protein [Kribbella amoyensis]|uniref:Alpha/beta hydrolase family protein n=1 Tax=Kribbella amoyensis TaxID=996641 RepID=A0A561BVZ3_9ACTN|nr:alpha/beta hydrolase [Kribbella amoyensis]TWD83003.1 alpha/beta hydrolase family protein [Kribbella amoyensis]